MTDPLQRFRDLLAAEGDSDQGQRISRICALCVSELAVSGAGATVLSAVRNGVATEHRRGLVHASNPVSAGLEDLQFTVGEGPCLDAFATGGPILVPDLAGARTRWPAFGPAAADLGVAAVFSFPLQIGVVMLGSLDLYRDRLGPLSRREVTDALILADLATQAVIDQLDGHTTDDLSWLADSHVEVNQAVGMVRIQLGATTDAALLRLRGHAFAHDVTLSQVCRQVVARTLRFRPEVDPA
ncbi:GAF and ANTAR domain-containing protein [Amycolatopsis sp. lyj-112]|uniref:GAF and ANTAR domain-containing protein n=1 Tax=Amycolatopsis sp. lyj-112 TaxID=2789288 RepID=UPI0039781B76